MASSSSTPAASGVTSYSGMYPPFATAFGLTLEEMAEGVIQPHTKVGLPASYDTPLTKVIIEHAQEQCLPRSQAYARAALLEREQPGRVSQADLQRRFSDVNACARDVMQRYEDKCALSVGRFQAALASIGTVDPEDLASENPSGPTVRKLDLASSALARLRHCGTINQNRMPTKSIPWYFKNADGTPHAPHLERNE